MAQNRRSRLKLFFSSNSFKLIGYSLAVFLILFFAELALLNYLSPGYIAYLLVELAFTVPRLAIILWLVRRYSSFAGVGLRKKGLWKALIYGGSFSFFFFSVRTLTTRFAFLPIVQPPELLVDLAVLPIVAFEENLVFHAIIIGSMKRLKAPLFGVLLSTVLFTVMHFIGPTVSNGSLYLHTYYFLFFPALVTGAAYLLSENILGIAAVHTVSNLFLTLFQPVEWTQPLQDEFIFSDPIVHMALIVLAASMIWPPLIELFERRISKTEKSKVFLQKRYIVYWFLLFFVLAQVEMSLENIGVL